MAKKEEGDPFAPPTVQFVKPDGTTIDLPTIPQDRVNQFYSLAGYIISQWSSIDRELFECFHAALKITEQQAAILYYAYPTIGARLRSLNEILSVTIDGDFLAEWTRLQGSLNFSTRNTLAHHPIAIESSYKLEEDGSVTTTHFIRAKVEEKEVLSGRQKEKIISEKDIIREFEGVKKSFLAVKNFKIKIVDWAAKS